MRVSPANRTLLLVGNFPPGAGKVRQVNEDLRDRFETLGWRVLAVSREKHPLFKFCDILWTVWRFRHHYTAAFIMVYSGRAFFWAQAAGIFLKILRKPYVLLLHGGGLPDYAERHPEWVRRLFRGARMIITPSRFLRESIEKTLHSDFRIRVIPNGIDLGQYAYRSRENPRPALLWLRAFHEIYAPELAVETLKHLSADYPDASLVMIGPDKGDGSLGRTLDLIRRTGLEKNVQIVKGVDHSEVSALLDESDIFLNTTTLESFGVSVLEAAAAGMCIISNRVGEIPYLWQDGLEVLLVPGGDAVQMAQAVKKILSDGSLASRMSLGCHEKAGRFDWKNIMPQWESVLRDVAGERT